MKIKSKFFSQSSKNLIQFYIKKKIFIDTYILIDNQDESQLELVMEDIWNTYSSGRLFQEVPNTDEVMYLQIQTIMFCVKNVLPNLKNHVTYINEQRYPSYKNEKILKVLRPVASATEAHLKFVNQKL